MSASIDLPLNFEPYQDVWLNGHLERPGKRTCARRYKMIYDALSERYRPGFSVLDIGASEGYFSIRLAEDMGASAVMLEKKRTLSVIAAAQDVQPRLNPRIGRFGVDTIKASGSFDVAIAVSILHHFDNWGAMLRAVTRIADTVIIELPAANERSTKRSGSGDKMRQSLLWYNPKKVGEVPGYAEEARRELFVLDFPTPPTGPNYIAATAVGGRSSSTRQRKYYLDPLKEKTGYEAAPGTFNLRIEGDLFFKNGIVTESAKGQYHFFPCEVEGLAAYVVKPPRAKNRPNSLELVCTENLRLVFGIEDGDTVTVKLDPKYLGTEKEIAYPVKAANAPEEPDEAETENESVEA